MGNKSENLKILATAGFRVPVFIDVPPSVLTKSALEQIAKEKLSTVKSFAVRSSASAEDGLDKSFAGHFCSEIGVPLHQLHQAYQKVSDSLIDFEGKVILQEFIPSSKSGVLFSNNGHGLVVVNSNFGLCKTVVEGEACDEWYINNENKLIRKNIATNKQALRFVNNEIVKAEITSEESLSSNELRELVTACREIENHFACPQDIEWCYHDEQLYILQARPITRQLPMPNFIYFDSANIAESYSGIVLPLTHAFAVNNYKTVYKNLLVASGVSRKKIEQHSNLFNSLVANYYGRMFYNMNNWYLMMSFLPGYKRNKQNLEKMLTMNVSEDIKSNISPNLGLKIGYPFIVIWKLLFLNRTIRNFEESSRTLLTQSRKIDFNTYNAEKCLSYYQFLEKQLLHNFHIPVENDFMLMTYLGILRKKYPEEQLRELLTFESISSKQVERVAILSRNFYQQKEFKEAIENEDIAEFKRLLEINDSLKQEIESYFSCYSGRFANELKLESGDIESDFSLFIKLLKAYKNIEPAQKHNNESKKGFVLQKFFKYASKREDLRLLRSNSFSLVRRIFIRLGEIYAHDGKLKTSTDIFYCNLEELFTLNTSNINIQSIIEKRKQDYEQYKTLNVSSFFALLENEMPSCLNDEIKQSNELYGRSCNAGIIRGKVRVFKEFEMPDNMDFDIIVAKNTDPGWSLLIGLSKGMIIENGGVLSHAAIVSRELGIPTIIGVEAATRKLRTGQIVELNGSTGTIKIIE